MFEYDLDKTKISYGICPMAKTEFSVFFPLIE